VIPERGAIVKQRKCERGLKRLLVRAGMSPSILAVWRLMTNSNLLACTTGRSAGLAPIRVGFEPALVCNENRHWLGQFRNTRPNDPLERGDHF
jgi:hypothetical protein